MKSDSDHISQILTTADGKVMARHEVNWPEESSNRGGTSPVKSENSNLVAPESDKISDPPRGDEPIGQVIRTCSGDTASSEPAQPPNSEWPPALNEALTMDERWDHWDRCFNASPRSMTLYDLEVIIFGRRVADHLREVFSS